MNTPLKTLRIVVTKTADGANDYVQILSEDQFSLNIVLISDHIELIDRRETGLVKSMTKPRRRESTFVQRGE